MADAVLTRDGPVGVPLDYVVPQGGELAPLTVRAVLDGTSAAAAFYAIVEVIAPSGRSMGKYRSDVIAAGGSADVTWFPGSLGSISATAVGFGGARIYSSTNQNIPDSTATDITFDSVDVDTLGMANLGVNNRILTATVSGFYFVAGILDYDINHLGREVIHVTTNGYYSAGTGTFVASAQAGILGNFTQPLEATGLVFLNAGDFISLGTQQTSGGSVATTGNVPENIYSHSLFAALIGV